MIFRLPKGGSVKCSEKCVKLWDSYRQRAVQDCEAGGILLARRIEGSEDIVIDEATPPHSKDRRTRFSFFRRKKPTQEIVNCKWNETSGAVNYLGEWHTHPEAVPTPSHIDKMNWRRIVRKTEFKGDSLVFVIVGIDETRMWVLERNKCSPILLLRA